MSKKDVALPTWVHVCTTSIRRNAYQNDSPRPCLFIVGDHKHFASFVVFCIKTRT